MTPDMPPIANTVIKPRNHNIGVSNRIRPLYIVAIQLNTKTEVGTAIIIVISPKKAFISALAPMVKKWCSHTESASAETPIIPHTADI